MKLDIRSNKIDPDSNFARAFQHYAEEAFEEEFGKRQWISTGVQTRFDKVREKIDAAMMGYLLRHDGVVDGWPDPNTGLYIRVKDSTEDDKWYIHRFHYFSLGNVGSVFAENATKYRNHYKYKNSRLYEDTVFNGEYHGVSLWDNRIKILQSWAIRLMLVWGVAAVVLAVAAFATRGITGGLEALLERIDMDAIQANVPLIAQIVAAPLAWLMAVPILLAMIVDMLMVENLGILGLALGCAVSLGICYAAHRWLIFKWDNPKPLKQRVIRDRIEEAKAFRNSDEYKRIVSEEEAKRKMCEEMSEQWHKAWYKCCTQSK